jgi:hypothetical protein
MIALETVVDINAYRNAARTYPSKRKDAKGLPMDAFREFIRSHSTRLTNRLAGRIIQEEKDLIRQRKANLQKANQLYMALQTKALSDK